MPLVPGAVEKVSFERGQQHPALHAALTFDEIYAIVVRAILDYNLRAVTAYPTPPEMVQRQLAPTPMNLWHFGMEVNGRGRSVDVDEFRLRVMQSEKAKIGPRGIEFAGLEYDCPLSLVERQSLKRAENKDTWVDVVGDTTDNSRIYLLGLGEPIECALAESVPDFLRGLSHEEVRAYKDFDSWNRGVQEANGRKSTAITEYNIRELARDAETKTKQELVERGMDHPDISRLDEMRDLERQMGDVPASQSVQATERMETEKRQSSKTDKRRQKNLGRRGTRDLKDFLAQQQAKASNDFDLDPEEETSVNASTIAEESESQVRNVFDSY
jgi:putative transposase